VLGAPRLRLDKVADRAQRERAVLANAHVDVYAARIDAASRGDSYPHTEPEHADAGRHRHPSRRDADTRDRIDADYAHAHTRAGDPHADRAGSDGDARHARADEYAFRGNADANTFLNGHVADGSFLIS
jgi:hypothetical protein